MTMSTNSNIFFGFRSKPKINLSNPRVMSMKKKIIAQKNEKGMEAIASLNRQIHTIINFLKYAIPAAALHDDLKIKEGEGLGGNCVAKQQKLNEKNDFI